MIDFNDRIARLQSTGEIACLLDVDYDQDPPNYV